MSDQTRRLPTVLSIVRDFMVESGFDEGEIGISESKRVITYAGWELGGVDQESRFYIITFKTNRHVYLNPSDPKFFDKLHEAMMFPKPDEEWGAFWHRRHKSLIPLNFI